MINITDLPAGPALDELVAIHVFGEPRPEQDGPPKAAMLSPKGCWVWHTIARTESVWKPIPFSSNIVSAWKCVNKLTEYPYVKVRCDTSFYHGDYCRVTAPDPSQVPDGIVIRDAQAFGETMPLAISRALLMATYTSGPDEEVIG